MDSYFPSVLFLIIIDDSCSAHLSVNSLSCLSFIRRAAKYMFSFAYYLLVFTHMKEKLASIGIINYFLVSSNGRSS